MNDITLSKEANTLIRAIYKEFKRRRKSSISKEEARSFGDSDSIQSNIVKTWNINDIDEACRELTTAQILDCLFLDNTVGETILTNFGISFMENRTSSKLSALWKVLEMIRSFLPW